MPHSLKGERLQAALAIANVPVLLLVLVHLTGSRRWIEFPYRPSRNPGFGDNPDGGLSEEIRTEVRDAAFEAITRWQDGEVPALADPSTEMLVEMLAASMGEPVPPEYGPMIAAELGIGADRDRPTLERERGGSGLAGFEVLVVGAGISGIAVAVMLAEAGIPYTIVEKRDSVGGTWRDNRYPGCGVDTPSAIYSYSFAEHDWSRYFAGRDEILEYLERVVAERGLSRNILFNHEVVEASYDEGTQRWDVTLRLPDSALEHRAPNVVITAVGAFTRPKLPEIPGLSSFEAPCIHTARWPDDVELADRRVGVVGAGASAMQVVPAIADEVSELKVFQRAPGWIAPFPYLHAEVPEPVRALSRQVPWYRRWYRLRWAWTINDRLHPALQKDPSWPHPKRAVNAENDGHRRVFTRYIDSEIGDRPALREAVLPDYPPFGKRILLDNGWYRTLTRDHVQLVTDRIIAIAPDRVMCDGGDEHLLDVLILATGFDVVRFLVPMEVRGRSGLRLHDLWEEDNPRAYLGTTVPGFPNLFILYGPNIQPGHGGSLVGLAEVQSRYVVDLLRQMLTAGIGAVECRPDVWRIYNQSVDEAHERMVWTHPGMETYYRNSRGRVVLPSPFRVIDLWTRMRTANLSDYVTEKAPSSARAAR